MKLIFSTILFSAPLMLHAGEIEGAFGFKFGEIFDLARKDYVVNKNFSSPHIETIHLSEGVVPPFDEYVLTVNPKTIEIDSINAIQHESKNCLALMGEYAKAISDKYEIEMEPSFSDMSDSLLYSTDTVFISVSCDYIKMRVRNNKYPEFQIRYQDKKLYEKTQAAYEQIKSQNASKIDKSLL